MEKRIPCEAAASCSARCASLRLRRYCVAVVVGHGVTVEGSNAIVSTLLLLSWMAHFVLRN